VHLNDYQRAALRTAAPKSKHNELFHLLLGLVGETGEIAEKAKKIIRDRDSDFSQWDAEDLKKELGDSLWYIAVIAPTGITPGIGKGPGYTFCRLVFSTRASRASAG
jgi:NTP pyrophosphatase (non-canonical NTP hydrolase)